MFVREVTHFVTTCGIQATELAATKVCELSVQKWGETDKEVCLILANNAWNDAENEIRQQAVRKLGILPDQHPSQIEASHHE